MKYEYRSIGELGKIVTGKTPPTEIVEYFDGEYPFITPSDIPTFSERYLPYTERTLSKLGADRLKSILLPEQAVCFVCIGSTIGKMCLTKEPSFTNQQINSIIPNKKYDSIYIFYLLRYIKDYFQSIGGGTGSGKGIVNKSVFSKTKIKILRDIQEQKNISNVISKYDDLIEVNNKRIKLLEQTAEEIYKEWFVRFRFPGYEKVELVNGIPKGWEVRNIKDFCRVFTGKKDVNQTDESGQYMFFSCAPGIFHSKEYIYDGEAVIIAGNGSYTGRTRYYSGKFDLYQRTYAIVSDKRNLLKYIYWTFKVDFEKKYIGGTRGAAIPYIVMGDITKYKFLYNEGMIEEYIRIVDPIYSEIENLSASLENLSKQRDYLLPRLMSGKVEV